MEKAYYLDKPCEILVELPSGYSVVSVKTESETKIVIAESKYLRKSPLNPLKGTCEC